MSPLSRREAQAIYSIYFPPHFTHTTGKNKTGLKESNSNYKNLMSITEGMSYLKKEDSLLISQRLPKLILDTS